MKKPFKKWPRKCSERNCRGIVNRTEHSPLCARHRFLSFKEKFPLKYSFGNLRRRAKERGKIFLLTFDEYESFAIKTDYAKLKGKTTLSLSIDRIENSLPYISWNIQAINLRSNSRKEYVAHFNGGHMPEKMADDQRHFDIEYQGNCWRMAQDVAKIHTPGSEAFWQEFHRRKIELFETVTT